jgi:cellulose synthase/poly-beta-1,6-N-acetylglucosamine synthase-like glycosyltransferase
MNNFIEDIDVFWNILRYIVTIGVIALFTISFLYSGKQESYYISQEHGSKIQYYCLYADVNWRLDTVIYCSENVANVLLLNNALSSRTDSLTSKKPEIQLQ